MKKVTSGNIHIVNLIGCVTSSEPRCLMSELVTYGSLLSYLRTHQKKVSNMVLHHFNVLSVAGTFTEERCGELYVLLSTTHEMIH